MPIVTPVPIPAAPPAPQRNDPATFEERNDAAVEYQFNTLPGAINQQSEATYENALDAKGSATATAADRIQTGLDAAATAADRIQTGLDALATAADRQAIEEAITDGPVLSVNGKVGIVTGLLEAEGGTATGLKYTVVDLEDIEGETEIDFAVAQEFVATVTDDVEFTIANPPASGETQTIYLRLTDGGSFALDWPSNTRFDSSEPLTLTAGGEDLLAMKYDSGVLTVYVIGLNVGVPA